MELVSANSRLSSTTELRHSTILCESYCNNIGTFWYEFLIQWSQHPIFFSTGQIFFVFTQKNKPNQRVHKFHLILVKCPKWKHSLDRRKEPLTSRPTISFNDDNNTIWTSSTELVLPEYMNTLWHITNKCNQCSATMHYAVSTEYINTEFTDTTLESTHFPIYLQKRQVFQSTAQKQSLTFRLIPRV